jgi:hypothetical protein
MIASV